MRLEIIVLAITATMYCVNSVSAGNFTRELSDSIHSQISNLKGRAVVVSSEREEIHLYLLGEGIISETKGLAKGDVSRTVQNSDYAFKVDKIDDNFFLAGVRLPTKPPVGFEKVMLADFEISFPHLYPFGIEILKFDDAAVFKMVEAERTKSHLVFDSQLDGDFKTSKGDRYVLDFDANNCLIKAERVLKNRTQVLTIDYDKRASLPNMPSKLRIRSVSPGTPESIQVYSIGQPESFQIDPSQLRLPFYGISEASIGIKPKRSSLYVTVPIAVVILVGIILFVKSRRRI